MLVSLFQIFLIWCILSSMSRSKYSDLIMHLSWLSLISLMIKECYISFQALRGHDRTQLWKGNNNAFSMLQEHYTSNPEFQFNFGASVFLLYEILYKTIVDYSHYEVFGCLALLQHSLLIELSSNLDLEFVFFLVIYLTWKVTGYISCFQADFYLKRCCVSWRNISLSHCYHFRQVNWPLSWSGLTNPFTWSFSHLWTCSVHPSDSSWWYSICF